MNTHTAYTGKRDPINCPANQPKPATGDQPPRAERDQHPRPPKPADQAYSQHAVDLAKASVIPPIQPKPRKASSRGEPTTDPTPYKVIESGTRPFKPASGEWTVETVSDLMSGLQGALACRVIADAHNTALAAERLRGECADISLIGKAEEECRQLRDQLAAEKENLKQVAQHANETRKERDELREQLAAEQKRYETERQAHYGYTQLAEQHLSEAQQQLAFETGKRKMLSDALNVAYSELAAEREKVMELEQQNKTFRAAQKACEDCDGPTMAEVQQMRDQLAAEKRKWEDALEANRQTEKLLAAEKVKTAKLQVALTTEQQNADSFCKQLAAAQERIEQLTDPEEK